MNSSAIAKLLRTREEMSEIYQKLHKENYKYPYFFDISNNKQVLYFLGTHHTSDPNDPQINRIINVWKQFLKQSNTNSRIVLIEGSTRPLEENISNAIVKHSEGGLLTFLANEEEIRVISPEPDHKKEVSEIAKKFGKEKTIYYYFARTVYQWQKHAKKTTDFHSYINIYLDGYKKLLKWEGFEFTIEHMIYLHNKFHKHEFDLDNEKCFYTDSNPEENPVSNMSTLTRDIYMVSEIIKLWKKGYNLFVGYGSGHAITQEPALRKLLT